MIRYSYAMIGFVICAIYGFVALVSSNIIFDPIIFMFVISGIGIDIFVN